VRIAGPIGFLVMDSVRGNPKDRSPLQRQRGTNSKEILKGQRYLIRPMRVQPMVAHADAKARTHPVEKNGDGTSLPAEHEQRGYGSAVEKPKNNTINPVYSPGFGYVDEICAHTGVQNIASRR
jgi:hypothetical protein